jgi:hypothetical protein
VSLLDSAAGRAQWSGQAVKTSHMRSSVDKVLALYTPEIAAGVTDIFQEDFKNFQYPVSLVMCRTVEVFFVFQSI